MTGPDLSAVQAALKGRDRTGKAVPPDTFTLEQDRTDALLSLLDILEQLNYAPAFVRGLREDINRVVAERPNERVPDTSPPQGETAGVGGFGDEDEPIALDQLEELVNSGALDPDDRDVALAEIRARRDADAVVDSTAEEITDDEEAGEA